MRPRTRSQATGLLRRVLCKARADELPARAASLAFTTLVAFVPLLAASTFLLVRLVEEGLDRLLEALTQVLPYPEESILAVLRSFLEQSATLSVWGTLGFLVLALLALRSVEATLETLFDVQPSRSLFERWLRLGAFLFWGPLAIGAAHALDLALSGRLTGQPLLAEAVSRLLVACVTILGLGMIYRLAAAGRIRFRHALGGALVATLLLELLRWTFLEYVEAFSTTTRIVYGGFAIALLFVLSVELAWLLFLLGATVALCLADPGEGLPPEARPFPRWRLHQLVDLLAALAKAGSRGLTARELIETHELSGEDLDRAFRPLVERGWLLPPETERSRWRLAVTPREVHLDELLASQQLEATGKTGVSPMRDRLARVLAGEVSGKTLEDLLATEEGT